MLAALLASLPTHGLSVDEAHYALYAYFPDWSYFDHPPLVGWIQLPGLWLGGSDFAMRLAPMACWSLALVLLHRLTLRLFASPEGSRKADGSVLVGLTVPMFLILAMSIHPDLLLLPVTCVTMLVVWRLRDPAETLRTGPWLALGAILGIAGLSKYTAVFLALSSAAVLLQRHGRAILARRGPWLALALAAAMASPVFLWNAQHHWVSFRYQGLHAAGGASWQLSELFRVQWEELKVYGPLTALAVCLGLWRCRRSPVAGFCLAFAAPPFLTIALLSGRGGSINYWTAFAWMAVLPLAGMGLAEGWHSRRAKPWLIGVGVVQAFFCLLVFARIWDGGPAEDSPIRQNAFADLYGWDQAAARARELAMSRGLKSVSVMNWTLASRIAWYARPFFVYVLDERFDQIDIWFGKLPVGQSTILIQWSRIPYEIPVRPTTPQGFARCQHLEEMPIRKGDKVISHFDFYLCEDWGGAVVSAPQKTDHISAY